MEPKKAPLTRPATGDYAPYYEKYISLVPGSDILAALEAQRLLMMQLFAGHTERDGNFCYAPGKWTVKEVLGHVNDCERIFSYRALCIARGETVSLPGFEQDDYVRTGDFKDRTLTDLGEEFAHIRNSTIALLRSLSREAWQRRGTANKNEITVRALAFIVAGHELHHRFILEERYFPAIPRA